MEENRYKLLNKENENVVQFNLVNTTSSPILVSLFNTSQGLSNIPVSPTYINPPNSIVSSFGTSGSAYQGLTINTITGDVIGNSLNRIFFFNSSGVPIATVVYAGTNLSAIDYNPLNNQLYSVDGFTGNIYVTDCTTYTLTTIITTTMGFLAEGSAFNPSTNTLYYTRTNTSTIYSIDCNTNTQNTDIIASSFILSISYNSINNQLYLTSNAVDTCIIYDLTTNSFSPTIITLPTKGQSLAFNFTDNTMYVSSVSANDIYVIDCISNTIISTIDLGGILPRLLTFDSNQNRIYATSTSTNVAVVDCSTNSFITSISYANATKYIAFNPSDNFLYFTTSVNDIGQATTTGITTTPYYISGSVNYNLFVNNLNNEPVSIQMIRLFVNNQNQLFNQLQLTKIDSNGNQIFLPDFPINQVSAYQQQGNIGEIPLDNIVFDGRTYINQYQLNANENVSFEIYYEQVDLTSASPTFPIFFKPKIQLKDYIKNN
jgi:hypothetical protein